MYSGPKFDIHSKYIYMAAVCSITMAYGPIMPILYVLCFACLLCLYTVERLAMAYSYYKPPMYNENINTFLFRLLATLPFMSVGISLWAYSNQSVFRDQVMKISSWQLYDDPEHEFYQFFTQITPATVWLVALPYSVLYWLFCRSGLNLVRFCKRCNDYDDLDKNDAEIVSPPDGD